MVSSEFWNNMRKFRGATNPFATFHENAKRTEFHSESGKVATDFLKIIALGCSLTGGAIVVGAQTGALVAGPQGATIGATAGACVGITATIIAVRKMERDDSYPNFILVED